jgi:phage repressor protein C with HTH and peptisase S24 domain
MHIQMERLYKAAKELRGVTTQAGVARAMNQSSQTVKNWETRGISKSGMLKAQEEFGCSATWLESGAGDMAIGREPDLLDFRAETAAELKMLIVHRSANNRERQAIDDVVEEMRLLIEARRRDQAKLAG